MTDDDSPDDGGYPASMRVMAVLGLAAAVAVAFILADVISGGKLAGAFGGGCGCDDEDPVAVIDE